MKLFNFILSLFMCSTMITGCGSEEPASQAEAAAETTTDKHLNINILIDLSDRIDSVKYPDKPEHYERDLQMIKYITGYFVDDMKAKGTNRSKNKIKVNFYPQPLDPDINTIAEKLSVDVSRMDIKQKKEVYDNLQKDFTENLTRIYTKAMQQKNWEGSDIWRFFKNDVKDYCVDKNAGYRNILIILTDGYLFHEKSKLQEKNRYSYLTETVLKNLRNNNQWKEKIKRDDFGLITTRNDLQNLDVLVLEITPSPNFPNDEDILKALLQKWFVEMNVHDFDTYNSAVPEHNRQRVINFLEKQG